MSIYKNQRVFHFVVATALVAPVDRAIAAEPVPPAVIAVTTCGDSGPGSLREALQTAPDLATIDLGALPCADHTIRLSSGEIAFANAGALSIRGLPIVFARAMDAPLAAVTIDAGGSGRVFSQSGTGLLRIVGVALQTVVPSCPAAAWPPPATSGSRKPSSAAAPSRPRPSATAWEAACTSPDR